jgi:hypothetical protein
MLHLQNTRGCRVQKRRGQEELPLEEDALGRFFGCLVASLRGETPEVASLEAPFTELWQSFRDALRAVPSEESSQGEEKHG